MDAKETYEKIIHIHQELLTLLNEGDTSIMSPKVINYLMTTSMALKKDKELIKEKLGKVYRLNDK